MQHNYTSESQLEGAWFSESSLVYCRWWWDKGARLLHVICGNRHATWAPPPVNPDIEQRLIEDFPEIAQDVARQL